MTRVSYTRSWTVRSLVTLSLLCFGASGVPLSVSAQDRPDIKSALDASAMNDVFTSLWGNPFASDGGRTSSLVIEPTRASDTWTVRALDPNGVPLGEGTFVERDRTALGSTTFGRSIMPSGAPFRRVDTAIVTGRLMGPSGTAFVQAMTVRVSGRVDRNPQAMTMFTVMAMADSWDALQQIPSVRIAALAPSPGFDDPFGPPVDDGGCTEEAMREKASCSTKAIACGAITMLPGVEMAAGWPFLGAGVVFGGAIFCGIEFSDCLEEVDIQFDACRRENLRPPNREPRDPFFDDEGPDEPDFEDPFFEDTGFANPGFGDPGFGDPEFGDPEFGDPEFGDPEFGDPEFGDPEFGGPEFEDPEFGDPEFGDSGFDDGFFGNFGGFGGFFF